MAHNTTNIKRKHSATSLLLKLAAGAGMVALCTPVSAVERRHSVLAGTILRIDAGARTIAVKTAEGGEHTFLFAERTTVHGPREAARGAEDAFHGLEKGGRVAVQYTAEGAKGTVHISEEGGRNVARFLAWEVSSRK
jgi:hypothetical protein